MGGSAFGKIIYSWFPALQYRNFRIFWFGQCISIIGTWMQNIGQAWLVLEMTHSAFKLSVVTTVQFLPVTFLTLWAGTLVDRFPKRTLIIYTQLAFGFLAAVLATLTWTGTVEYWHVLILALLLGTVSALDVPLRQAFFIELVGREVLPNAIALNSSIFNLGRILGPAVAGLLIGLTGIAACFYLNALSFLVIVICLLFIKVPAGKVKPLEFGILKTAFIDIRDSLRYIGKVEMIKQPLILLTFISLFVMNYNIVIPVFAKQELNQNATGFGLMMTSMGVGSFLAALMLAAKSRKNPKLRYMIGGAFFSSLLLILLALENNIHLAFFTLFFIGFNTVAFTTLSNTVIQLHSSDEMRGRVLGAFMLVFGGVTPFGSLYTGNVIELTGVRGCMAISGAIGILAVAWSVFSIRRKRTNGQSARI